MPRRIFLRRAGLSALAVSGTVPLLANCASGGDEGDDEVSGGGEEQTEENPFGVSPSDPLSVVIFNGGYGEEYAKFHESIYQEEFPDATINHQAITDIRQKMQPKFASSEPPDVLDNAGAEQMPISTLADNGQLTDLTQLWEADALGFEGMTVQDTLHPIAIEAAEYAGKPYVMNYALQVYGIWYDQMLFDEKGWQPAQTWSEFQDLCETIKSAGIAPMAHQGKYPYYIQQVLMDMAVKHGGPEVVYAIDSLADGAWQHDSIRMAAEALLWIKDNGYMLEGTEGLDHIQSQTEWNKGEAAFIPSGSWLENEQAAVVAEVNPDFKTTVAPTPLLDGAVLPFESTRVEAAEAFIVPADAANQVGGLEYVRIMLSKDGARKFTELTSAPTVVNGAADGLDASPGLASSLALIESGGDDNWNYYYTIWYSPMRPKIETVVGELAAGRITADEFCDRCQDIADQTAADPTTQQRTRT
ncbi:MAG TPA: N-acetylglucosamine/diacetylchitobiose ABC transporter substrate-binding protein [Nocardioidaceae bacterium]|nr:N-acetylglucosamine/diacetylchitobiose ABC transporter substrate-binding protein [Nocardioidaceae bacterium]